jgi:hypothetical protein
MALNTSVDVLAALKHQQVCLALAAQDNENVFQRVWQ